MDQARIHEGIRRMRLLDVPDRTERTALSQLEAAECAALGETVGRCGGCPKRVFNRRFTRMPQIRVRGETNESAEAAR
jgi:hypothetical protein